MPKPYVLQTFKCWQSWKCIVRLSPHLPILIWRQIGNWHSINVQFYTISSLIHWGIKVHNHSTNKGVMQSLLSFCSFLIYMQFSRSKCNSDRCTTVLRYMVLQNMYFCSIMSIDMHPHISLNTFYNVFFYNMIVVEIYKKMTGVWNYIVHADLCINEKNVLQLVIVVFSFVFSQILFC